MHLHFNVQCSIHCTNHCRLLRNIISATSNMPSGRTNQWQPSCCHSDSYLSTTRPQTLKVNALSQLFFTYTVWDDCSSMDYCLSGGVWELNQFYVSGDSSALKPNVEWEVTDFPAKRIVEIFKCCPEPYPGKDAVSLSLFSLPLIAAWCHCYRTSLYGCIAL